MNFLQLCQDLVSELGLAGGSGPSTVANQQGELKNVVRWIRDACLGIDNLWQDWRYLHVEYLGIINANTRTPTPPNTPTGVLVRVWDRDSIEINYGTTAGKPLTFEEWATFRKVRRLGGAALAVDEPTVFTIRPDGALETYPTANADYPVRGEFWRRPLVLTADTDVPMMPEEYHRLIVCAAAVYYANREDAPEIIGGMEAEYAVLIEQLQSDQAPGFAAQGRSTQDLVLEGAIPGMD